MEFVIPFIAIALAVTGLILSAFPGPGPPLVYVGMLLMQWQFNSYSAMLMWVLAALIVLLIITTYVLPVKIAQRFGASKYGTWGGIIGMVIGLLFTPIGMLMGMFLGAVLGELAGGRNGTEALKAGVGTFLGNMMTIVLKIGLSVVMFYYVVKGVIMILF